MASRPTAVNRVFQLHWALVGLAVLTTLLVVLLHDQVVEQWAMGNATARELFEAGGAAAVEAELAVPAFTPVAVVFCLVYVGLVWVLLAFLDHRAHWAQWSLSILLVGMAVGTVGVVLTGLPGVFVVIAFVSFGLEILAFLFLWHPDTRAFVAHDAPAVRA